MTLERTRLPKARLGVNIDHVATIRNARGGAHPDPAKAAAIAEKCWLSRNFDSMGT